jgi:hypothetical protein
VGSARRDDEDMPSIADLRLPPSPRENPLSYPGRTLGTSYLWLDNWIYRLAPAPGRRLGDWVTGVDGGPLAELTGVGLNRALAEAGVPALDVRYPVLAFGSNAAPAQLLDKFKSIDPSERVIPVTRGSVMGFALSHSPHVSNPGYIPYVVVDSGPAAPLPVHVLWLDETQLRVMNRTEPNYRLVNAPAERYPLTLESGETVAGYSLYRGNWGALRWPAERGAAPAGSQEEIFARMSRTQWFRELAGGGDTGAQQLRLGADKVLRDRVRAELADRNQRLPDGWSTD